MAFTVKLQQNNSDNIMLDKDITDVDECTGTLRQETSIYRPTILLEVDISLAARCNYMTIAEFDRQYFIRQVSSIRNGVVEVIGVVDVLSTFKDQIRENEGIVRRQEEKWNLYINDGSFRTYQNPMVLTKKFPSGFSGQSFVMAVAGK